MSTRDQPTPPFNSPYQQAIKSNTTLLQSPAYPSPARSDSEPTKYPTDGLGLYNYSQSFHAPHYPPSPQPTEAWAHLTTGASPLNSEGPVEAWSAAYDPPVSRSPMPWASHHASHRSSLSSNRDLSMFSREGTDHAFPHIKLEAGSEWVNEDERASHGMRNQPMTVSPDRLTTTVFAYDHSYGSPPLSKYEPSLEDEHENREYQSMSYSASSRSPPLRDGSVNITARTRLRRNPTTPENANYTCHLCGKLFQRSYNHKTHLETHNPSRKKEHICPHSDCDKLFVRKTDLDRHQNSVHRKLKQFKCPRCDAHFARKDTLRRHEEDGCPKRNEVPMSQRPPMQTGQGRAMPYYHSPRPDMYDTRSPPLFRDESFPGSPSGFQ